jgi:hypothetical protein
MNLANLMNMTNFEMGLIAVEGTLVAAFFLLWRILRQSAGGKHASSQSHSLRKWVQESEAICQNLSRNLEEKGEIADRLVKRLDEKIQTLQILMGKMDQAPSSLGRGDGKKDLHAQIFEMTETGYDLSEIARRLRISKGEVQLALDLKRYRQ